MKTALVCVLLCLLPGLGAAATLTGSIVDSSAAVNLSTIGSLDWARWPGYTHKGSAISNVTTTGTLKTSTNDPRLMGDYTALKVSGIGSSFEFTVAATAVERTLTYYVGGWNSTGRITVTLAGAPSYSTTVTSTGTFSRVVTVKFRADSSGTLKLRYEQTAGGGSINMQGAALSQAAGSATLTWQSPPSNVDGSPTNLAAYKVYWGTAPGTYPYSARTSSATVRTHTVTGLVTGTYYFVVTALNANGLESAYSNVWSKIVP